MPRTCFDETGISRARRPPHIAVLGAGPAGLSVGYYAKRNGVPFTIYEATNVIGGNCITIRHKDFLFDSGAHRLLDKDSDVTRELKKLLGEDLIRIDVPSHIYWNGMSIDFPLSPCDLMKHLGTAAFLKAAAELVFSRLRRMNPCSSFADFALHAYGKTVATQFLLNYSQKLWGTPCDRLSPKISGERMAGLNLRAFLSESIPRRKTVARHSEDVFYYPRMGIGAITMELAKSCGIQNIRCNAKVTRIFHDNRRIHAIEINERERIDTDLVVSTLPLNLLLQIMEPRPPKEILLLSGSLRYRNVVLVATFLAMDRVTQSASVYFPHPDFVFTRIHEPKNRAVHMSPAGKTSLVAEIPCQDQDEIWNMEDDGLKQLVSSKLLDIGWIRKRNIIDSLVIRLKYCYPVLEVECEQKVQQIKTYLSSLGNLRVCGRSGNFMYGWIHQMIKQGKAIVEECVAPLRSDTD